VFDELHAAIEELEAPVDERALAELIALRDRLDARITAAVGEFDSAELWDVDGSTSMAAWLRRHTSMTPGDAKRTAVTASRVRRCPALQEAWSGGRLSSGQVAVVVANVSDATVELFEQHEAGVVANLVGLDIRDTTIAMRSWAMRAEVALALEGKDPTEPTGTLHLSRFGDGNGRLDGNLDAEGLLVVGTALRVAESRDAEGEARTPAQRRCDALVDVCRFFLDHQKVRLGARHRPHLNVVSDLPALAAAEPGRTLGGMPLSGAAIRQIACDANVHRVITDGQSAILDFGRATRTIPPAVFTALALRDVGCRFPGCDRPGEWCEGHHIQHWQDGGATDLSNLVLLCSRHHHVIHDRRWELKLLPSGVVEVTDPRGRCWSSDPPLSISRPPDT
jgi:hypothetical protein